MKKAFLIIILLYNASILRSQTISGDSLIWENSDKSWVQIMDDLFEAFNDSNLLTHSVLADKSTLITSIDSIIAQDLASGKQEWVGIYNEWYHAHTWNKPMFDFIELDSIINFNIKNDLTKSPIIMLFDQYHKFKPDVWNQNYVTLENFKFEPQTSNSALLFDVDTLFFASMGKHLIENDYSIDVYWSDEMLYGNLNPDSVFIEAEGSNNSLLKVLNNIPVTIYNNYADTTFVEIKVYLGGKIFRAKSYLIFDNSNTQFNLFSSERITDNFGDCEAYYKHLSINVTLPLSLRAFNTQVGWSNKVQNPDYHYGLWYDNLMHHVGVWLGCGNTCIKRPVILVEGYDPTNSRKIWGIKEDYLCDQCVNDIPSMQESNLYYLLSAHELNERLYSKGYDVIILDFKEGLASLDNLAGLVKVLLRTIKSVTKEDDNSNLWCAGNTELAIMGPSQAGLIVRQALAEMEDANEEHNVRLFYSFDAPHQGANIPLSLQYGIDFMYDNMPALQPKLIDAKKVLNATPTKQLLKYYYNDNLTNGTISTTLSSTPEFANYFNHINQLNDGWGYPKKCRNVAISNGSGIAVSQRDINALSKLYHFKLNTIIAYNLYMKGYALPNTTSDFYEIFNGTSWRFNITWPWNIIKRKRIKSNGILPLDNAPGGNGDFIYLAEKNIDKFLHGWIFTNTESYLRPNFISTISGLDLLNTTNVFYNVKMGLSQYFITDNEAFRLPETITKFDGIYVEDANMPHVICGITPGIANFVMDELMPDHYYLQNRIIEKHLDVYAKNHVTAGYNVTNRVAVGDFVVQGEGHVNITAGISVTVNNGTHFVPTQLGNIHIFIEQRPDCQLRKGDTNNQNEENNPEVTKHNYSKGNNDNEQPKYTGSLHIYPNPAENLLNIEINSLKDSQNMLPVYISNLMGQRMNIKTEQSKDEQGNFKTQCDISKLSGGIYVIVVESEGRRYSGRFVKN